MDWMLVTLVIAGAVAAAVAQTTPSTTQLLERLEARVKALEATSSNYKEVIKTLARQVSMQQFYVEETTRSTGDSGLKRTRLSVSGPRPYHATHYSDLSSFAAIHDHSNYQRTLGMGELIVVLNGVEFRTRHNDYRLVMPSTNSRGYLSTEPVPLPEVPPEVLAKPTVEEQSVEMRKWFKAWRDKDHTVRDYRKYFKPVLCYMEGMWTEANSNSSISEPNSSLRHKMDAQSFSDLQNKARYSSATGRKSLSENYAFLPTTISGIDKDGFPHYSQWNYQILCHPIKKEIPPWRFKQEDDLSPRVSKVKSFEQSLMERYQRFSIEPNQPFNTDYRSTRNTVTSKLTGSFLDEIMAEIPGKDNYPGKLTDNVFNDVALQYQHKYKNNRSPQNVAYYHRLYKISQRDAMGSDIMFRSFSDANLYVAFNSRPQITPTEISKCRTNTKCSTADNWKGVCQRRVCQTWTHRVSYAIPLEIIYMTPLLTWNPYDLQIHNDVNTPKKAQTNGTYTRTGGNSKKMAFSGISPNYYFYQTPVSFYGGTRPHINPADTVYGSTNVLDKKGNVRQTMASGTYVITPNIPGVGSLRQRYPIMPLHQSGNAIFKELEALKDITLRKTKYAKFYRDQIRNTDGVLEEIFTFDLPKGESGVHGPHYHTIDLTTSDIRNLKAGKYMTVRTSSTVGHSHELQIRFKKGVNTNVFGYIEMVKCDDKGWQCPDGHKGRIICNECHNDVVFPEIN